MRINIPLPCPRCDSPMYAVSYDEIIPILKRRSWQVCKNLSCRFFRDAEKFKREMCCI